MLVQLLILLITFSQLGQNWRTLCWMLHTESVISSITTSEKPETWWWNEQVDKAVQEKLARFKFYTTLKRGGKMAEAKEAKTACNSGKSITKHAIWLVKSGTDKEEFTTVSPNDDGIFCIVKQMDCTIQDVVCENCVQNEASEHKAKTWWRHGLSAMLYCPVSS